MRVTTLAKVAVLALASLTVAIGCADTPLDEPPGDFTMYLFGYGQVFTPQPAPADAADWRAGLPAGFPFPGALVHSAAYGVVTCVEPAKNCANRGLVKPGEVLPIWVVSFADSVLADDCPVWATIDARTGQFINGSGPPCR